MHQLVSLSSSCCERLHLQWRSRLSGDFLSSYEILLYLPSDRIVASLDLELLQMNVKATFLSGEIIYIEQPTSFELKGNKHGVCCLTRFIVVIV